RVARKLATLDFEPESLWDSQMRTSGLMIPINLVAKRFALAKARFKLLRFQHDPEHIAGPELIRRHSEPIYAVASTTVGDAQLTPSGRHKSVPPLQVISLATRRRKEQFEPTFAHAHQIDRQIGFGIRRIGAGEHFLIIRHAVAIGVLRRVCEPG